MNSAKRLVVLLMMSLSFSCVSFGKPTEVVYLIPEGFTGGVIIIYNQPDGITPETNEDGTIIYRIPKDGFLKVKSAFDNKAHKFNFYFVDDKDKQTPIEYVHPEAYVRNPGDTTSKSMDSITEDEKNNGIFIMNHRITSSSSNGNKTVMYVFSVGHPKDSIAVFS